MAVGTSTSFPTTLQAHLCVGYSSIKGVFCFFLSHQGTDLLCSVWFKDMHTNFFKILHNKDIATTKLENLQLKSLVHMRMTDLFGIMFFCTHI